MIVAPLVATWTHQYSSSSTEIIQQPVSNTYVKEYPVNSSSSGPYSIVTGSNNLLWFTEYYKGKLGSINSQNGTVHEYSIPETDAAPVGLAVDSQNMIWIADENGRGQIWLFNPENISFVRSYHGTTINATDFYVTVDSSNNVWFSELTGNNIGEIPHGSLSVNEYSLPNPTSGPSVLTIQSGTSYLWVSENYANKIARFDMASHTWQEYPLSPVPKSPLGIAMDHIGNVWVAEHGGDSVDQYFVSNSTLRQYPTTNVGSQTAPATISVDTSDRIWFVEHVTNRVGRLDPKTGIMDEFVFPSSGYSIQGFGSTIDSAGNFWFTLFSSNAIGLVPGSASFPVVVKPITESFASVSAGTSQTVNFEVSNPSTMSETLDLSGTSTLGNPSQVRLANLSVTLDSGQNTTVALAISPDPYISPGMYGAGLVTSIGNASSTSILFLNITASPFFIIRAYLPAIIISILAVGLLTIYLFLKRRRRTNSQPILSAKKIPVLSLMLIGFFSLVYVIAPVTTVQGKCPGLPQPPVSPGGGTPIDPYGVALDAGAALFFGIVAYLLVKDWMKRKKTAPSTS